MPNILNIFLFWILIFGLSSIFSFNLAHAQTATFLDFAITIEPIVPKPNEEFTATIPQDLTLIPLASSTIEWFVNGIKTQAASGTPNKLVSKQSFEGPLSIKANIILPDKQIATKTLNSSVFNTDQFSIQQDLENRLRELQTQSEALGLPSFGSGGQQGSQFSISADNSNPAPKEKISLRIDSFFFDPDRSFIQWFVNGKKISEGTGEKFLTIETGDIGSKSDVRARVTTPQGQIYENSLSITPFALSLYWWADTSVPYWYKGKALPTVGNTVRISAFAPTGGAESKNIIYKWSINENFQAAVSGVGRQIFSFRPQFQNLQDLVRVKIENLNKTLAFEQTLTLHNVSPEIWFCVIDIFSGCSKGASQISVISGDSVDIKASPFFFGKDELKFIKYTWDINGRPPTTKATSRPQITTIKIPQDLKGSLQINLSIESIISKLNAKNSFILDIK